MNPTNLVPSFKTCQKLVEAGVKFNRSYFVWVKRWDSRKDKYNIKLFARKEYKKWGSEETFSAPLVGEMGEWLKDEVYSLPFWNSTYKCWMYNSPYELCKKYSIQAEAYGNLILEVKCATQRQ